ncbi:MAG: DUF1844 domain-containing protein [Deltaproteobacteria bacterium]|nr:DUF1844 domain-containing protein [Deltaproteobacteria bacterium]
MTETTRPSGIDFTTFILSISSAAFMGLGLAPKPGGGKHEVDLELARQNIDLLELLKEKTKSNLTADETKLLDNLLYETRMRFIEVQKKGSPS